MTASDDGESISSNAPETELRQTLKERHVNMIGFSVVLGVGLFLSTGKCIFISGPGMTVIAYLLMGTLMWYVPDDPPVLHRHPFRPSLPTLI